MRISSLFSTGTLLLTLALGPTLSHAQAVQGPEVPEPVPTFELDKKGVKRDLIDFSLDIKPISSADLKFSQFKGKKLMVFYFSAKCPHCQHAAPYVQRMADDLAKKGFTSLAIAIKYNSEEDIRGFIRDFSVRMPIMQDEDRTFGDRYGVGTIPVIYLVNEKGEYIRYRNFDAEIVPAQVREAISSWPSAKKK